MTKKSIVHTSKLPGVYLDLYNSKDLHDIILVLNEVHELPAHRLVLAAQSSVFRALFYGNSPKELPDNKYKIVAPLAAFELFLKYIYSGTLKLDITTLEPLIEVLKLSSRYELKVLETTLVEELMNSIDYKNVNLVKETAAFLKHEALHVKCLEIIDNNGGVFLTSDEFLSLNQNEVIEIFSRTTLVALTIEKFIGMSNWLKAHPDAEKERLLFFVDISRLSNNQLIKVVAPTKLYKAERVMSIMSFRNDDVNEEIVIRHKNGTTLLNPNILSGKNPQNLLSTLAVLSYCKADLYKNERCIVVDLGAEYEINHLSFTLKDELYSFELLLGKTMESLTSIAQRSSHFNCKHYQDFFFTTQSVRFVKITGAIECNSLEFSYTDSPPECIESFIVPKKNVFTLITAEVLDAINGEDMFKEPGFDEIIQSDTKFAQADVGKRILIQFFQPYWLHHCRIRFWDLDNTGYFYSVDVISKGTKKTITDKRDKFESGWQEIKFAGCAVSGFEICVHRVSGDAVKNKMYKIVAFEAY